MEPSGGIGVPATSMLEGVPAHFVDGTVIALFIIICIILSVLAWTWRMRKI